MMYPYAPFAFGKVGMMIGGGVLLLVFLALLALAIVGIVLLARHGKRSENPKSNVYRALAILDERYAKGELTDEEYEQKKAALKKE